MNIKFKALVWVEAVAAGIIPLNPELGAQHHNTELAFKDMSPEDVRRMKRKFRKLWRKHREQGGLSVGVPNSKDMNRRKEAVIRQICYDVIKDNSSFMTCPADQII